MPEKADRRLSTLFAARYRQGWFLLASAGLNLALFGFLSAVPRQSSSPAQPTVIPVSLVELLPPPPPPPEPVPEPVPSEAVATEPPAAAPAPSAAPQPREDTPAARIETPIIAEPGEAADAALPSGPTARDYPEINLPVVTEERAKVRAALRSYGCDQLRGKRSAFCDDGPDPQAFSDLKTFAEEPELTPPQWAAFELQRSDPDLQRIRAEGCPPNDGVINDVFVGNSNPNLQGAAGMLGTLARGSHYDPRCD